MTTTQTTTDRLETLSNAAASALARENLPAAQAATVGMRHVLEAHPRVRNAAAWWAIHDANAEQCGA